MNCENEHNACKQAAVHTYPTLRFYQHGQVVATYKGLLQHDLILNALKAVAEGTYSQVPPYFLYLRNEANNILDVFAFDFSAQLFSGYSFEYLPASVRIISS